MSKDKIAIIIPIYKTVLSPAEIASLIQVFSVLGSYKIYFACSHKLQVDAYLRIILELGIEIGEDQIIRMDSQYFSSISGYNRLLLSKKFYLKFKSYQYMLIYQLDCWVFRDELRYWCDQGFDYIGAPWFSPDPEFPEKLQFSGVGNGGFSLRKVNSYIEVLNTFRYIKTQSQLWRDFKKTSSAGAFLYLFLNITILNNTHYLLNTYAWNEDLFWGAIIPTRFSWFKVPGMELARRFSFEENARELYKANNNKLPFGCHKWEILDSEFWRQFIIQKV